MFRATCLNYCLDKPFHKVAKALVDYEKTSCDGIWSLRDVNVTHTEATGSKTVDVWEQKHSHHRTLPLAFCGD